ncbi:EF-Tu C-terminal domain-related protein [Roseivirga echinicomitans]
MSTLKAQEPTGPFLMTIEDVFNITGRGVVAVGRIENGTITPNEKVEIIGFGSKISSTVTGIESFRKLIESASMGDNVGLMLSGVKKEDLKRGMVIALPGSTQEHKRFEASLVLHKKEEGGNEKAIFDDQRVNLYLRKTDVLGTIKLIEKEMLAPGDSSNVRIEMLVSMPILAGQQFAITERGRTIGTGTITKIINN